MFKRVLLGTIKNVTIMAAGMVTVAGGILIADEVKKRLNNEQ